MSDLVARTSQFFQQPPQQIWLKASAVLPPWVTLILVVAIAWHLARIVWLLVPAGETVAVTAPPPGKAAQAGAAGDAGTVNIDTIVAAHLFGELETTALVPQVTDEDPPDTRLNLELRGTIAATESETARAIIAEQNGNEKVYSIGDAVTGGAQLHFVYPDRVLLRRGGQLETLRLPRAEESTGGASRRAAASRRTPTRTARSIRDVVAGGAVKLTDVIRPQPVFRDGKQQGYRVYPGRERAQFAKLGLRPGDMITQINGMALDDPARGMEIFRNLGESTQVSVTVERSGQAQVLTLDTSQLSAPGGGAGDAEDDEDE